MACYHPIKAWQRARGEKPVLLPDSTDHSQPPAEGKWLVLPCGGCIGCLTDRATQWADRCSHEQKMHAVTSFLTLTYDPEHLPPNEELEPDALQRFHKRVRKLGAHRPGELGADSRSRYRYLACGEYGEKGGRPHYHVLAFGIGFPDRKRVGHKNGHALYSSETLRRLWPYGDARVGDGNAAAASYIAQYTLKKIGARIPEGVQAPFLRMSTVPPLGTAWLDKHRRDLRHGFLVAQNGRKHAIPRAYRKHLEKNDPELLEQLLAVQEKRRESLPAQDPDRLVAAEVIHTRRKQLMESRKY